MAVIPESAEVKAEAWSRGDWHALREKLPSAAWLRSRLPRSATDWYIVVVIAIAGVELLWSVYCKLSKKEHA